MGWGEINRSRISPAIGKRGIGGASLDDLLDQLGVSGGELMLAEFFRRDPGQLLAGQGLGLAGREMANKGMQANLKIGIGVGDRSEWLKMIDRDVEFFAQLAMQAIHRAFARLLLPAGEFPVVGEGVAFAPLGDQDF